MEFVRRADTRQLLQLVEQLSRLSLTLAATAAAEVATAPRARAAGAAAAARGRPRPLRGQLREQQGRVAQAVAARRAAELLTAEHTRRTHAACANVHGLTATPEMSRTTGSTWSQGAAYQPAFSWPGRPAGPAPASRPGRER